MLASIICWEITPSKLIDRKAYRDIIIEEVHMK